MAAEKNVANVQFFQVNLAGVDDEERVPASIPLADNSIDLFINRRGPILKRYLKEAIRVARHGAVILGLHPGGNTPTPIWLEQLPELFHQAFVGRSFETAMSWVVDPLQAAGISDYSLWWLDVPELFQTPHDLYVRLIGPFASEAPEFQSMESQLTNIIEQYGTSQGLALRHQRLLWLVHLPK